jgi:VCBS repeat-containing protein
VGTLIGTLTATDADTGDSLTFAVVASSSDGTFALDTNGQLTVADTTALPTGLGTPFVLTVQVTDSTGLTATATVTVQVLPTVDGAPEPETPSLPDPDVPPPVPFVPSPVAAPTSQSHTAAPNSAGTPPGSGTLSGPSVPPSPAVSIPAAPEEPGPFESSLADAQDGDDDTEEPVGEASAAGTSDGEDTNVQQASTRAELAAAKMRTVVPVELGSLLMVGGFMQELDKLRDEIRDDTSFTKTVVGSSLAATTGLSIGYVLWLIRGGMLLSSVLSSLPAWRLVDPLPILASLDNESEDEHTDDDSLESLVEKDRKDSSQEKNT